MGACRENLNLFTRLGLAHFLQAWKFKRINWKLTYEDTINPIFCFIVGHTPYHSDPTYDPNERACKKCHKWLREET